MINTKLLSRLLSVALICALLPALFLPGPALASTLEMGQDFDAYTVPNLPYNWEGADEGWATINTKFYTSPNSVFRAGPVYATVGTLVSQPFTPFGSPSMVTFNTHYVFESYGPNYFDGGVLEISIAGGDWTDILAAGGVFERGGYTGTLATWTGNPMGGRQAWIATNGGWSQVRLRLPLAATGQYTRLRWRFSSDRSHTSDGWWIDDVAVINPDVTATTLSASASASIYGDPITFTTVTTSGGSPVWMGSVTFLSNDVPIPGCIHVAVNASGQAVCTTGAIHPGSYTIQANYVGDAGLLGSSASLSPITVTHRPLTATATGVNKVYDGLLTATVAFSDDRVSGDDLTYSYAATFSNKDVGNGKPVNVTDIALGGSDAEYYIFNVTTASTTANITPRPLIVTATGVNKVYDGLLDATVTLADNRLSGDNLTLSYTAASFNTKNVGSGHLISVTGIVHGGADAANYTPNATASTTANITPRALTVTATGVNKVYDGLLTASVLLSDNRFTGDDLTYSYAATFGNKDVGNGKPVSVTGIAKSGADSGNYTLVNTTASAAADITARPLVITVLAEDKVYDATTGATVSLSDNRVPGDLLDITYTSAAFAHKNVGVGKTVTVSGLALGNQDGGNYTHPPVAYATASITPLAITGSITAADKAYDGAVTATLNGRTLAGVLPGDVVSLVGGVAAFADPGAGADKPVSVSDLLLSGADAGNYTVNTTASATAAITPAALLVQANDAFKLVSAPMPAFSVTYSGFVNGETEAVLSGALVFDTPATHTSPAGEYPLTPSGLTSNNYSLTYADGTLHVFDAYSTTKLEASHAGPELGSLVTLTATVSANVAGLPTPLGAVTFFDAGAPVCVDVILDASAVATCQVVAGLPVGLHLLTAQYTSSSGLSNSTGTLEQTVQAADLAVVKTASVFSARPGDWVTYTLAYSNLGTYTATQVTLTDTLPAGLLAPSGQPLTWTLGNLAPGAHGEVSVVAQVQLDLAAGVLLWNSAEIASAAVEAEYANNTGGVNVLTVGDNSHPNVYAGEDIPDAQEGAPVTFQAEVLDLALQAYLPQRLDVIFWDFGDGGLAAGTLAPSHTYLDDGVYTVTLAIVDQNGLANWDQLVVTVANQAPSMGDLEDASLEAGGTFSLQASFSDPGVLDTHTVTVVWAPGVTETVQLAGGVHSFNLAHTYLEAGTYTVTVIVTDNGGLAVTRTLALQVTGPSQRPLYLPLLLRKL